MKQMIIRIKGDCEDAEILNHDMVSKKEYFSAISLKELYRIIEAQINSSVDQRKEIQLFNKQIIGYGNKCVLIKQKEHRRIVTYKNKAFNIVFPNALYILHYKGNEVSKIEAYCYKEFNGEETRLFEYAMPNMLSGNCICMGSAPKSIVKNDYVRALENIIFTQYTHDMLSGIRTFKDTKSYFKYLEKNAYPYDLLIDLNKKLKQVIK